MIDFGTPLKALFIICLVSVPLGIWKMIDIIIWFFENVSITMG